MKRIIILALIVVILYTGKFLYAQDWSSILPSPPVAKSAANARVFESGDLTPRQELGFRLFFDPILSSNNKVSCATCHDPDHGFASRGRPVGLDGFPISRRAPSLVNCGTSAFLFWDGRANSLEEQARGPLLNREEMGNKSEEEILGRLRDKYEVRFTREYTGGLSFGNLTNALAEFERTIQSPNTNLEAYLSGTTRFGEAKARGYELFRGKAGCYQCHPVELRDVEARSMAVRTLTDDRFHNTGLFGDDRGRYNVTKNPTDLGAFKTPGLRGCSQTAPYMHDASLKTLADVVDHYNRGGADRHIGVRDRLIKPLGLTPQEKSDLVEFLKGL